MPRKTNAPSIRDRVLEMRRVPASELLPNPRNWRIHNDAQRRIFRDMLDRIGFAGAELTRELPDGRLMLIDGHMRQEELGDTPLPVLVTDLTEQEADALLATFDPLGRLAGTDSDAAGALIESLGMAGYDAAADLLRAVAANDQTAALLESLADGMLGDEPDAHDVDDPSGGGDDFDTTPDEEGPTRCQPGDLWQLGAHRLLCGDSTKREDVARLMDGQKASLVVTSPPYTDQREYGIGSFDWDALMRGVTDRVSEHLADVAHVLVNLGPSHKDGRVDLYWLNWLHYCDAIGLPFYGWYVWDKGAALPGDWNGRLGPSHEFMFHFRRGKAIAHKWVETHDREGGRSSRTFRQKDGSTAEATSPDKFGQPFKVPDSVIRINREAARGIHTENHPAVYPVALPEFVMNTWSAEGDAVYEPFCGSGTTIIAAQRLERRCYAMEISPRYCDVILRRWEAETGREATLLSRISEPEHATTADVNKP